jgi:hypothetical protein
MTKIPEEHRAARELYEAFRALGQERGDNTTPPLRAQSRSGRVSRVFVAVPVAVLTLVAAAGAARVLFDDGPALRGDRGAPHETRRAEKDTALAAVRAADPDGGLKWGLRLYTSATGGRCAIVGRVKGRSIGVLRDGHFLPVAADAPGTCGAAGSHMLIARRENAERPVRSVLYGFVDRSVKAISVTDGSRRRAVTVASDGSFLVVTDRRLKGRLVITTDGRTIRRHLG